jgi:hypothetical protein
LLLPGCLVQWIIAVQRIGFPEHLGMLLFIYFQQVDRPALLRAIASIPGQAVDLANRAAVQTLATLRR